MNVVLETENRVCVPASRAISCGEILTPYQEFALRKKLEVTLPRPAIFSQAAPPRRATIPAKIKLGLARRSQAAPGEGEKMKRQKLAFLRMLWFFTSKLWPKIPNPLGFGQFALFWAPPPDPNPGGGYHLFYPASGLPLGGP